MLKLENVCYSVNDNGKIKHILKNVSFEINKGEIVVVTGHNGSGKSTLMKIIMGIVPVSSGKIYFEGKDITNLSITERAKLGLSYAFQTPIRFKGLTVRDLLSTASSVNDIGDICNYLSRVGLCARDYIDRELDGSLSGGELKRIEIATTFARKAKFNIFDEPEAGIDIWSFDGLISAFRENKENYGGTNIIISHQEKIMSIADKIIVMDNSMIGAIGQRDEILSTVKSNKLCSRLQGEVL